jgi:hypothetical protein
MSTCASNTIVHKLFEAAAPHRDAVDAQYELSIVDPASSDLLSDLD